MLPKRSAQYRLGRRARLTLSKMRNSRKHDFTANRALGVRLGGGISPGMISFQGKIDF
jgi:hypothetical protein